VLVIKPEIQLTLGRHRLISLMTQQFVVTYTVPQTDILANFHSCTVHLDTVKVLYLPTDAQWSCFKQY